jgi:uncharacterized protein
VIRVTLDSNVLISAFAIGGKPMELLQMAIARRIELAVSDAILDEMAHVLARPKFAWAPQRIRQAQELLRDIAHHVAPQERLDVVTADPSDNRILECAQTSRSDVIITGDKHLLRLKSHTGMPIIRVSDSCRARGNADSNSCAITLLSVSTSGIRPAKRTENRSI